MFFQVLCSLFLLVNMWWSYRWIYVLPNEDWDDAVESYRASDFYSTNIVGYNKRHITLKLIRCSFKCCAPYFFQSICGGIINGSMHLPMKIWDAVESYRSSDFYSTDIVGYNQRHITLKLIKCSFTCCAPYFF